MSLVKPALISAALACAMIAAPMTATAGVVVKSSGPSAAKYPVGTKLDDKGRITLKAGDSVTILTNGGTRVIRGAGTHRVAKRGASKRSAIQALTRRRAAGQVRTGATRGDAPAGTASNPNMWWVDVTKSGTMCVADMSAVQMWRPGGDEASTYVLASAVSAEHVHKTFPAGETTAAWDAERLPLTDGASYTITGPGGTTTSTVTFAQLESAPDAIEDLTLVLLDKGCTTQVEQLTASLM